MRKWMQFTVVGLVSLILTGCTTRLIDFTAISSKNCEIAGSRGERVRGEDMTWMIWAIPVGGRPDIKEAVDRAIQRCNGDMLTDGVLYQKSWWLLVGQMGYVVEGTC